MPALAQGRKGALLPGPGRTSVRRTTRFSHVGSPRGEAPGAFHDRCRSLLHPSLACLIRRFRRWKPFRDSVDHAGRALLAGGLASLGIAHGKIELVPTG